MPETKPQKFTQTFFASCPTGLEALVVKELEGLGINSFHHTVGGVSFESSQLQALELLLSSRVASRVYKKVFSFFIKKEKDLYYEAKKIKWKGLMELQQTFRINTIQGKSPNGKKRSHFKNSMHLSFVLKDAIVDSFKEETGQRPNVDTQKPDITFLQFIAPVDNPYASKEEVSILIDLVGFPLGDRGYRITGGAATVRENLAAGILLSMGKSLTTTPFIDTMCGTGTFLIEAALIKVNMPASFKKIETSSPRKWSFQEHVFFKRDAKLQEDFNALLEDYRQKISNIREKLKQATKEVWGIEKDRNTIKLALQSIHSSGLESIIDVSVDDALTYRPPTEKSSLIFCNPPYGVRLGREKILEDLYYQYGENLKQNFKGHLAYIFTGNPQLAKKVSLRTSKRQIFFNGNIECRLLEYQLY